MLIHESALRLQETYNIRLNDSLLVKLEDAYKNRSELLVTIAASHYGLLNGNRVIYRHDTVKNNIGTFIHPNPKPIITNHRPKQSKQFGRVIAVDYKLTDFEKEFSSRFDFENMSTADYMNFCKDELIPYQQNNTKFNGLGYCEVVGKIDDREGIKKVLNGEFLRVSIGADPKKLVCSHCLQDQMVEMCDHYSTRQNGIFFLAEALEYEELSFLTGHKNPADPGARVTTIHDEIQTIDDFDLNLDFIDAQDFFQVKLADSTKTIVCVDNICKIVNQEETMARKSTEQKPVFNISYLDEFTAEELGEVKLADSVDASEALKLTDEAVGEMKNSDFAIVQKTDEGTKRRFPIHTKDNVEVAVAMFSKAQDLTPSEVLKAKNAITKAAKKFEVEAKFEEAEVKVTDAQVETETETEVKTLESVVAELKDMIVGEDSKLQDEDKASAFVKILDMLKEAGEDNLKSAVGTYLESAGLETVAKEEVTSLRDEVQNLQDSLAEANEQIELLDELNRDLNVEVRASKIDEIIDIKQQLGILKDSVEDEKAKLVSYPYGILVDKVNEFRELKATLGEGTVINKQEATKTEVTTVADPTLTDSEVEASEGQEEAPKLEDENKVSEDELVALIRDLLKVK